MEPLRIQTPTKRDVVLEAGGQPAISERVGPSGGLLPPGQFSIQGARLRAQLASVTGGEQSYQAVIDQVATAAGLQPSTVQERIENPL